MVTKIRLFLIAGLCCLRAVAQSADCAEQAKKIDAFITGKQMPDAVLLFDKSQDCAKEAPAFYPVGETVLLYKLDLAKSPDEKRAAADALATFYNNNDLYFPGNENGNQVKKAMLLYSRQLLDSEETYKLLDQTFNNSPAAFSDARALYTYFDLSFKKQKAGNLTDEELISIRDRISSQVSNLKNKFPEKSVDYSSAMSGINALISPLLTCDRLGSIYERNYEKNKENVVWLSSAAGGLAESRCTSSPIFLQITEQWQKLQPGAESDLAYGKALMRNRQQAKAVEYLSMGAELQKNPVEKAQTYYEIAVLLSGNKRQSASFLKKALASDPAMGKAYLQLAQLYAVGGKDCSTDEFDKKAIFFLAAKTAKKAGEVDKAILPAAQSLEKSFLKNVPTKDEIKRSKKGGKEVKYGCWINESITIPK
ncbi:MAG: hypothetical protein EOO51_01475 [Flavobacterium sp.]|nr:MAG: hypothetical protein EOO51_01475 [Flavobacterium sp.]